MSAPAPPYKRLPGSGGQLLIPAPWVYLIAIACWPVLLLRNRVRLFQGADHVLSVNYAGYTETYKRFYYREIQAISMRRTREDLAWNAVWVTLLIIFTTVTAVSNGAEQIGFAVVAGVFALCLATNLFLGPTCVCHLQTAVQTEGLLALNRVRTARKTIGRIREQVAQHQSALANADPAGEFQSPAPIKPETPA